MPDVSLLSYEEQSEIIATLSNLYSTATASYAKQRPTLQSSRQIATSFAVDIPLSLQSDLQWFTDSIRGALNLDPSTSVNAHYRDEPSGRRRSLLSGNIDVEVLAPSSTKATFDASMEIDSSLRSMQTCVISQLPEDCSELAALESSLINEARILDIIEVSVSLEVAVVVSLSAASSQALEDSADSLRADVPSQEIIQKAVHTATGLDISVTVESTMIHIQNPPPPPRLPGFSAGIQSLGVTAAVEQLDYVRLLMWEHPLVSTLLVFFCLIFASLLILMVYCFKRSQRRALEAMNNPRKLKGKSRAPECILRNYSEVSRRQVPGIKSPRSAMPRCAPNLSRRSSLEHGDSSPNASPDYRYDAFGERVPSRPNRAARLGAPMRAPSSLRGTWPTESYHGFVVYAAKARLALRRREEPMPAAKAVPKEYGYDHDNWNSHYQMPGPDAFDYEYDQPRW